MDAKIHAVKVQPLAAAALAAHGCAVSAGGRPPDSAGEGWQCWYPLASLEAFTQARIGLVRAESGAPLLRAMERHLDRPEWVFALDQSIVQAVALSSQAAPAQPDAQAVRAVLLNPGEGLIIAAGVWHAPGRPAGSRAALYGFVLGAPAGQGTDSGWVPFACGEIVQLIQDE